MKKILWCLRFTLDFRRQTGCSIWVSWRLADSYYDDCFDIPPTEAVSEEISNWG